MTVLEAWPYAKPVLMTPKCNLREEFAAGAALQIETSPETIAAGLKQLIEMSDDDRKQRVVGIVHNAVDAQLAGSDQIEVIWTTEVLRQLAPLLRAAREAGRLIILTGDHGHVLDGGTVPDSVTL